ncbi:MAG: hypothetical protein AAFQ71_02870 [Planctomycetota bacterium]
MGFAGLTAGCLPQTREGFGSPDPNLRLDAIVETAQASPASPETGGSEIRELIVQLESADPAARMFAIRSLERRTGQTLGYDHAAPEWERREAVREWVSWAEVHAPGVDSRPPDSDL